MPINRGLLYRDPIYSALYGDLYTGAPYIALYIYRETLYTEALYRSLYIKALYKASYIVPYIRALYIGTATATIATTNATVGHAEDLGSNAFLVHAGSLKGAAPPGDMRCL